MRPIHGADIYLYVCFNNPTLDSYVIYRKKETYSTHMDDGHPVNFNIIQEYAIVTSDGYLQKKKKTGLFPYLILIL